MRIDPETPAGGPDSLQDLITKLTKIRASLINHESDLQERASTIHPAYRKSAINLIHYMALRHLDIRILQDELAALGLSSLGRTEAHVMSTLNSVLVALQRMAGREIDGQALSESPGFREGRSLLAAHTEALLGPAPEHRSVRIMVTMSSAAADDYQLVRELVSSRNELYEDKLRARFTGSLGPDGKSSEARAAGIGSALPSSNGHRRAEASYRSNRTGASSGRMASQARQLWTRDGTRANLAWACGEKPHYSHRCGRIFVSTGRMANRGEIRRTHSLQRCTRETTSSRSDRWQQDRAMGSMQPDRVRYSGNDTTAR